MNEQNTLGVLCKKLRELAIDVPDADLVPQGDDGFQRRHKQLTVFDAALENLIEEYIFQSNAEDDESIIQALGCDIQSTITGALADNPRVNDKSQFLVEHALVNDLINSNRHIRMFMKPMLTDLHFLKYPGNTQG